jgi:salicylate hydroxylase
MMTQSKPHVLIAGGGIGGTAAALALLRSGFEVSVYEQASELREVGAGIQISPNGNRALDWLGVFETLRGISTKAQRKDVRLWSTGRTYPAFEFGPEALRRYGYPYLTVYRPDLLQVLVDAVRAIKPDAIHLGKHVKNYEKLPGGGVAINLSSGERVTGDLLVGADGVRSQIRQQMVGGAGVAFTGMVVWRAVVPMDRLPPHFREPVANAWMGPKGHILQYPLREAKFANFVATVERDEWTGESWTTVGTAEECARDFAGWHEDIHTLIHAAPELYKWALMARQPLENWTDGPVGLLGDACHPTLPLLAQGAVMAIEDSVVLARCLAEFGARPKALERYSSIRGPITRLKVQAAVDNLPRFHNPAYATELTAGPAIEAHWGKTAIEERYDWVYRDDVTTAPLTATRGSA